MACSDTFTKTIGIGEWLFRNGQSADCAVLVRKGSVKLLLDGRLDIGTFGQGSVLGVSEVFAARQYQTDAFAVQETLAEYIPQRMLFTLLLHDPKYRLEILNGLSNDVIQLIGTMQSLPRRRRYRKMVETENHQISK
jgi:CRP-like cAMP-binding protein